MYKLISFGAIDKLYKSYTINREGTMGYLKILA